MATTYQILSKNQIDQTVFTEVEYNIDGTIVTVNVPHFMPENEQAIIDGIINRSITEKAKLESSQVISTIVDDIDTNIVQPINVTIPVPDPGNLNPYATFTNEELQGALVLLDQEYAQLNSALNNNAQQYDLIIAELNSRL